MKLPSEINLDDFRAGAEVYRTFFDDFFLLGALLFMNLKSSLVEMVGLSVNSKDSESGAWSKADRKRLLSNV